MSRAPARRLPQARCDGCNSPIVWTEQPDGTRCPMDPRRGTVFRVLEVHPSHVAVERVEDVHLSHFHTCPNRAQFSRERTPRGEANPNA